ncbi:MAG TPA: long-chain fatty acid--CoA ligase [Sphingomonas sp.]|nr:long-chain fatty acid--CoA ligase [Sphingomonas sp.]
MSRPAAFPGDRPAAEGGPAGRPPVILSRSLPELLDKAAADYGERNAIDFLGRTWSYAQIDRLAARAARGLQDIGVTPGTRVALCLPNTPYYVILYFAILRIGGIVVNVNPLYVERELEHLIRDSGAKIIAAPDVADIHARVASVAESTGLERIIVCPIAEALPPLKKWAYRLFKRRDIAAIPRDRRHIALRALIERDEPASPVTIEPDDVAVLQYTGGTTGTPKAAMLTHANLTANSEQMRIHVAGLGLTHERTMGVLPLFHVFALTTVLNYSVDTGAEMVLLPRFDMKQFLATMARRRCTQLFAVPTIYTALNGLPESKLAALKSLKFSISGGAPLPFDVRAKFERRTGCPVVEGYGLTEAAPIVTCNPLDGAIKANSAGPAFPATTLEIRDLDDPHRVLGPGERGEVCARGPQVMKGYWNRPADNEAVFVDGALRTGDVGYLDEDGYLFLVDRIKDVILCGGYNVYPRVIEEALYEHPAIAEAVVIGVPDKYRGQSPKAFVTLREGKTVTPDELCAFLTTRINKIEMPREIEIRENLPKTLIGKLSKKELVAEELARAGS